MKKDIVLGLTILFVISGMIPISLGFEKTSIRTIYSRGYIQGLIDNASAGDTVSIPSGIYCENIKINKSINLIGEDKNNTIINGGCIINASFVNFSGFTINHITLTFCGYTSITENIISNSYSGIKIGMSGGNTISRNIISDHTDYSISLGYLACGNLISNNIITNSEYGLIINSFGMGDPVDNIIENNSFINTGIFTDPVLVGDNFVLNNTVNFRPLFYLDRMSDIYIYNAGQIILRGCNNISIQDLELCNTTIGIIMGGSQDCEIKNNTFNKNSLGGLWMINSISNIIDNNIVSNNKYGINLSWGCTYNILSGNNIIKSNIGFYSNSNNNKIYHNNFMENIIHAFDKGNNIWDNGYPSGGNYWDDYTGEDNDGDEIGDTPYPIPGGDNEDKYPFMNPNGWINKSDLDCSGILSWMDIEPGITVNGTINVYNIGYQGTLLNWEIESYPDWGTWSFDPLIGTDLLAGDSLTIDVEVVAPDEEEQTFTGEVVLINSVYPNDTCTVDVSLATPLNQIQPYKYIPSFIQIIIEKYPILGKLFNI